MRETDWYLLMICGGLLVFALVLIFLEGHVKNIWAVGDWVFNQPIFPLP